MKIKRNSPCPCGTGKKFKQCCLGRVDWPSIAAEKQDPLPYLSARGRNLLFLEHLADVLQLDSLSPKAGLKGFKDAFTVEAVRKIFEAVDEIWGSEAWIHSALEGEAESTSALYMGTYEPESIQGIVGRASLYSDSILLPDPFPHPRFIRPQFNPLSVPEQHVGTALRFATLWLMLAPWIEAGVVKFVRPLGDLDPELNFKIMESQRAKFESEPRLKASMDEFMEDEGEALFATRRREIMLSMPDAIVERNAREMNPSISSAEMTELKRALQRMKDEDPYFVEVKDDKGWPVPTMMLLTTGANLEEAKLMANLSGSHLLTDLRPRWVELEMDRESGEIDDGGWSAFSKAFQAVEFTYLDRVPLNAALKLRKEERLSRMRAFLRRVWKSAVPEQSFTRSAIEDLGAELRHEIVEAETEWAKIDRDLLKWFGSTSTAGAMVAPVLGTGAMGWAGVGLGVALAGVTELAVAFGLRESFAKRFPAGFFMVILPRFDGHPVKRRS